MRKDYFNNRRRDRVSYGYRSFGAAQMEREKQYKKKQRFLNRMIFCLSIALIVMTLKALNIKVVNLGFNKMSAFLSSDTFSLNQTKDIVVSFIDDSVAKITGKESVSAMNINDDISLIMPVKGKIVKTFKDDIHPVFNTNVSARGIEIETAVKGEEVICSHEGVITNIIASEHGGSRVVMNIGGNKTVVYDGVRNNFTKVGDKLNQGSIIGTMTEKGDILALEVWIDNTAVNPENYIEK